MPDHANFPSRVRVASPSPLTLFPAIFRDHFNYFVCFSTRLDPSSVPRRAAKGQPKKKVTKEEMTALMEADSRVSNTDRQLLLAKERQATADREKKVTEATLRAIADLPEVCESCWLCARAACFCMCVHVLFTLTVGEYCLCVQRPSRALVLVV